MKTIALLHTVKSVYLSFPDLVTESVGDVAMYNTLDEYLVLDTIQNGGVFSQVNVERLYQLMRAMESTDADLLLVSCSSLTPALEKMRWMLSKPLVCIDGEMLRQTLAGGSRVAVVTSNDSGGNAARQSLELLSAREGIPLDLEMLVVSEAFAALRAGDKAAHDRLLVDAASSLASKDSIMLAQASIAHLEDAIHDATGIRTLSSPRLCMDELRRVLAAL